MIAELKPYAEYKKSGLPWLGQVPGNWVIKRGKSYLVSIDERSKRGREELLTVSSARGVVPRSSANVTMFKAESYAGHKLCWPGDLVINSLWAWAGGLGVSQHHGIISTAYSVYRSRPSAQINHRFLHELVRSSAFHWELQVRSKGVWISRLQLTDTAFLDAPIPLPPPDEQAAIVRFLDWATGKLERAIRAKRKVITLLGEQKQAIIHRAVTRGLDPSAPLKPSGIPWLSDIPQHWEMRKIKSLVKTFGGMTPNKGVERYWTGRTPWVSPKDMKAPEIFDSKDHISDAALEETNIAVISAPAVLIVVRGMILARTFPTAVTRVPVAINQDMKALVPRPELSVDYFSLILTGIQRELLELVQIAGHGTCCLRTDSWSAFCLPIPPLEEQEVIRRFLSDELATTNTAISRLEREIELLREYRTRLVADVVTGKLDVREAAARLPVEAAPDTVEDDTDLSLDPEAADEEAAV
jgi:type I restriction enzyme S subunit